MLVRLKIVGKIIGLRGAVEWACERTPAHSSVDGVEPRHWRTTMAFHEFIVSVVGVRSALLVVCALGFSGCAAIGPQSISAGRGSYAEVINSTEDEQILNVIVRMRYDETFTMISVASVTATLRFRAEAGANVGIGNSQNYAGNLVPLSAGIAYEESPTISYVPLNGEDFMRRMLSPVTRGEWLLLAGAAKHPGHVFALVVSRVNGMRNPLLRERPSFGNFVRFVELYDRLRRAQVLDLVQRSGTTNDDNHFWYLHDYEDTHGGSVREFLDLLGIETKPDGSEILLPVYLAVGSSVSAIHMQMRTAQDVLRVAGAGIEIPPSHLEAGIVGPIASAALVKAQFILIRSSEQRPDNATVRIRFRDRWFYIDATDMRSKQAFVLLQTFIGVRLADPGASKKVPLLTIPVK